MNELTVFSKEIIPVYTTEIGEKVVIGRELHERLRIGKDYSTWFKDMCNYGFSEGTDFSPFSGETSEQGGRPRIEHILKIDMAKHIAMIQRTAEGKAIRDQLIALETNVSELSPELRLLISMELKQKEHDREIAAVNQRVDGIREIVSLSPASWREECRRLLAKIAQSRDGGGAYQEVNTEIFELVDQRGGVSLETRLKNKRRRMADDGVCKSRRDKLTKVDVIADDKKLIEIYIAIVKEMAVKSGVSSQAKAGIGKV